MAAAVWGQSRAARDSLTLNDETFTVIGIMPRYFRFPMQVAPVDAWLPLSFSPQEMAQRNTRNYNAIARLRPGASLEQAQTGASSIAGRFPNLPADLGVELATLHELVVGNVRPALLMLLAAVACCC